MSIRGRLQALKKVNEPSTNTLAVDHLVIGSDLYSLEVFYRLKKNNCDVKFVSASGIDFDRGMLVSPSGLRGQDNIALFGKLFPQIPITKQDGDNLFYKDSKWRDFGGRSKSEKILEGEEFYIFPRAMGDLAQAFSCLAPLAFTELKAFFEESNFVLLPIKIELINSNWLVHLSNGLEVTAKNLYWGNDPKSFTQLFQYTGADYDHLLEFTDSTASPGQLYWRAMIPAHSIEERQTLFIPQSYTHDWGHFIGEVTESDGHQIAEFITLFSLDDVSEEEIGRQIKAIKKGLEKIYPKLINQFRNEYLNFSETSASTHLNDPAFELVREKFSSLHVIGENAPVNPLYIQSLLSDEEKITLSGISHYVRGLTSIRQAFL